MRQFVMRLAAAQGKSVRQVLAENNSHDLSEWMAFERLHTLDPEGWKQTGQICSTLWAVQGKRVDPDDFIPKRREGRTVKENLQMMQALFGGGNKPKEQKPELRSNPIRPDLL